MNVPTLHCPPVCAPGVQSSRCVSFSGNASSDFLLVRHVWESFQSIGGVDSFE